jgi:hypothetical protein
MKKAVSIGESLTRIFRNENNARSYFRNPSIYVSSTFPAFSSRFLNVYSFHWVPIRTAMGIGRDFDGIEEDFDRGVELGNVTT